MSLLALLETLATSALVALAVAAATIVVLGLLVGLTIWLSGSRTSGAPNRS